MSNGSDRTSPAGGWPGHRASERSPSHQRHRACPKKLLKTGCFFRRVKPSKWMLGDKAYDSAELREDLHERGTKPIIPNRCNRKQPLSFSKRIYKLRWRIESAFNRLKDFRRIATRYDRLARNYLASVCLAAALIWWI